MNKRIIIFVTPIMLIVSFITLSCNPGGKPEIFIDNARLVSSPTLIGVASAFMHITNDGKGSDRLTGCSIEELPFAKGKLHDVVDGKMMMLKEIKIPANKITALRKGGKHLMFLGLPEEIEDEVLLILNFKNSGPVVVKAKVD
jgi:copper(I)-binding protein